jgi:uncharacterized SAM-binding protein YcdF (DUF218 family)
LSSIHRSSEAVVRAKRSSFFPLFLFLLLLLAAFYAPSFLIISEVAVKSDAVVLFLGGKEGTREKEARQLVEEGYADYLIIPAYGQIKKRGRDGSLESISSEVIPKPSNLKPKIAAWIESTHKEAIIAQDLMEQIGVRSALMVSSPYHMRRIKLITRKVFKDRLALQYVPTRYETAGGTLWIFSSYERKLVLTEYAKIVWFLLYSSFFFVEM